MTKSKHLLCLILPQKKFNFATNIIKKSQNETCLTLKNLNLYHFNYWILDILNWKEKINIKKFYKHDILILYFNQNCYNKIYIIININK